MSSERMRSETKGVGALVQERRYFEVPAHQRDYAWPPATVEQFFHDITSAVDRGDEEYFIGLIVIVDTEDPDVKRFQVLDGQQRLATTTMILAAIRHWLNANGRETDARRVQEDFIGFTEYGEIESTARLVMNVENRSAFQEVVVGSCDDNLISDRKRKAGRYSSTRMLLEAAELCRDLVTKRARAGGEELDAQARALTTLTKYLRDCVLVTCLHVSSPKYAYIIFESLNDRGIDLAVLYLVKNHLFEKAGSANEGRVQTNWTRMLSFLGNRKADGFLKAFWTSRHGRTQRGRLFHEMKEKYNSASAALGLSDELARIAEVYAGLEVANGDVWTGHSAAARKAVDALSILGALQTHPILLAGLERLGSADMEALLQRLVVLIVRYQLVGRERTGRLEIMAANVAEGIYSRRLNKVSQVWLEMKGLVPDDEDFRRDFENYSEAEDARARFILRQLEVEERKAARSEEPPELEPIDDPARVNLEHVLPKNPDASWESVLVEDPELVQEYLYRVGNLCLLSSKRNREEAARGYMFKKDTYAASEFLEAIPKPRSAL